MRPAPPNMIWNDLLIALSLLTRLPVPHANFSDDTRPLARAGWAYPLVGAIIGALAALLAWGTLWLGVPASIAAIIFLGSMTLMTGAMHEDGLADCADGFWGGWVPSRRLAIMKDSAIGTYGVLALIFAFGCRWVIYAGLLAAAFPLPALMLPAVISRAAMVGVMFALPEARMDGLSSGTGAPSGIETGIAIAIGIAALLLLPHSNPVWVLAATGAGAALVARVAVSKIGGKTGDVLGATQVIAEICCLMALSALVLP